MDPQRPLVFVVGTVLACTVALTGCSPRPAAPVSSGASAAPTASAAAVPMRAPLSVADVRAVLASLEKAGDPNADYRVDVPRFAESILGQMPLYVDPSAPQGGPTTFPGPDYARLRPVAQADASATVAQADALLDGIVRAKGPAAAERELFQVTGVSGPPSRDRQLLDLLAEGAGTLTFMFGAQPSGSWSWKVTGISITGTDTADVTFAVSVPKGGPFRFSRQMFVKHLHFGPRSDGAWVLDGWPGYPAFERDVRTHIVPQDVIPNLVPNWWDTIGLDG